MKTVIKKPMLLFMSLRAVLPRSNPLTNRGLLRRTIILLLATTLLISSCSTLDAILATPTFVIPTQTPPPTPTYNWFPASATSPAQSFSTQAPTPEMRPGLGNITLTDSFKRASLWDTATSNEASAEVLNGQINLAAQSKVFMNSLRQKLSVNDFYAEITASPNLCRGGDTYGILIRANAVAYYRFGLSCDGAVSAEKNSVGKRLNLQSPFPSGDVPSSEQGKVRIGVWAVGTEMRLFLNDNFQFSITDASYPAGTIGVFVNSADDTPIIVSFSDLVIYDVSYSDPTQTP